MAETQTYSGVITRCESDILAGPWDVQVTLKGAKSPMVLAFFDQKLPLGSVPLATGQIAKVQINYDIDGASAAFARDDAATFPKVELAGAGKR